MTLLIYRAKYMAAYYTVVAAMFIVLTVVMHYARFP